MSALPAVFANSSEENPDWTICGCFDKALLKDLVNLSLCQRGFTFKSKRGNRMRQQRGRWHSSAHGLMTAGILLLTSFGPVHAQTTADSPLYAGRIDDFQSKSLKQKVQLLADREEIRDLIATYAHRAAHRLSMADLFTDDGAFINRPDAVTPPMEFRGRAALDKFFNGLGSQPQQPLPMIHNFLISVQGDEARALTSIEVRIVDMDRVVDGSGYYRDTFRRENGRWKFVVRDCTFFNMIPMPGGAEKPGT